MRVDLDGDGDQLRAGDGEALLARPRRAPPRIRGGHRGARARAADATFIFNTLVLDKSIDDRLRGYETWLSARNLRNDTTDEAVRRSIDATVARYDVVQRYYRLKARLLGLDRLPFYDRMAPIGEDPTKTSWDEAQESCSMRTRTSRARRVTSPSASSDESWIDAPVRENKRTGAFCATNVPGVHPYVFMNFTGDRRSILTLAHELGHGLHGYLAQPLGLFNANTPLTTAETASVFGEALTFKRLLAIEEDPSAGSTCSPDASRTRSRPSSGRSP